MGEGEGKSGIKSMILSKLNIEKAKVVAFVLAIGFVIHNIVYLQNTGKISTLFRGEISLLKEFPISN